jgi:Fur family ferric uptake transcriptional regulator
MPRNSLYNTKQKKEIFNVIVNKKNEWTIKEIYEDLNKSIGLTTIYRYIDKLVMEGEVNKNIGKDNITYYQYLEKCNNDNHFYLKCNKCGKIEHVDCDCISDFNNHISKEHKFNMNTNNIIINGICSNCIKKENKDE